VRGLGAARARKTRWERGSDDPKQPRYAAWTRSTPPWEIDPFPSLVSYAADEVDAVVQDRPSHRADEVDATVQDRPVPSLLCFGRGRP